MTQLKPGSSVLENSSGSRDGRAFVYERRGFHPCSYTKMSVQKGVILTSHSKSSGVSYLGVEAFLQDYRCREVFDFDIDEFDEYHIHLRA